MDLNKKLKELKPQQLNCNVFDVYSYNGLTMQDLLCQFFTTINECVKSTNEVVDLTEWLVNVGLEEEVVKKLMGLIKDGTIEKLINVNLFNTLNTQLENKANKNEVFSMVNMGQDIKEAMTGGSVAVVGKNAILTENIVDEQITKNKLTTTDLITLYDEWDELTSNADVNGNWCNEIIYKRGFIKTIKVKINGSNEKTGRVFIYEKFSDGSVKVRKEFKVSGYGVVSVSVNEYIPYEFYVSTNCEGVGYKDVSVGKCASLGTSTGIVNPSFSLGYTFAVGVEYDGVNKRIETLEEKYFNFKNRFYGKKYTALGDSITKGENSLDSYNPMIGYRYTDLAKEYFDFGEVVNLGKGGSRITRHTSNGDTKYGMIDRLDTIPNDTDILCVFGGTNDFAASVEIGTVDSYNYNHFKYCIKSIITTTLAYYPDIKMYFITPIHRNDSSAPDNIPNAKGYVLKDYVDAIKEVCGIYGIPVLDLYNNYGISPFIESQKNKYMPDGLHPIPEGMKILAHKNNQFIENTL